MGVGFEAGKVVRALWFLAAMTGSAFADDDTYIPGRLGPDPEKFAQGVAAYDAGKYAAAFDIWLPLAQRGDPAAMRNVGHLLRKGLGVEQDQPRALYFYQRAAEAGLTGAQANLGLMHLNGEGTPPDAKEAAKWLYLAARGGHVIATFELGRLVETGSGLPQNPAVARKLYERAAAAGFGPALARLSALGYPAPVPPQPGTMAPVGNDGPAIKVPGTMEPIPNPKAPLPRERPKGTDPVPLLLAPPPLRGALTDGLEALQMPMEADDGRAFEAAFAGFGYDFTFAPEREPGPDCRENGPFDPMARLCRMPPIPD